MSYKNIYHYINSKFVYYSVDHAYKGPNGTWIDTTLTFYDPTALISTSRSFGVNGELRYHLFKNEKFAGHIALNSEVFLYERYKSKYEELEETSYNVHIDYKPLVPEIKKFYLASSNISILYRHIWHFSPSVSLGGKLNVGTNLSSDWDQFRKYIWLGVGLEIGFGNQK